MILVTGATGTTGRLVVRQLLAAGASVRAFVRDAEAARAQLGSGVELAIGDLDQPATLQPALTGVERLFLLTPADPRQVEQQGHAVDLATQAGVRHVVKLSALGASPDAPVSLARWHAQTEQQIEESGLDYTHLRPHYFMQNTLMFKPTLDAESCFYLPMKDARISMVDCLDVADVAVAALTGDGHAGKTYEITGPEAVSFEEVATELGAFLGRKVIYVDIPPRDAEKAMVAAGIPDWLADALVGLYSIFSEGHASQTTDVVAHVTGRPARRFRDFLRDNASAFTD